LGGGGYELILTLTLSQQVGGGGGGGSNSNGRAPAAALGALTSLNLSHNQLTSFGVCALTSRLLPRLPHLRSLMLAHTRTGHPGVCAFPPFQEGPGHLSDNLRLVSALTRCLTTPCRSATLPTAWARLPSPKG
jgi:hypothetical protein